MTFQTERVLMQLRLLAFQSATTYNALIQSHFDYYNLVYGNCDKTFFDWLQKLQNRAARVLTFFSCDTDANCLIRQRYWNDSSTQFQIQKAIMVYKSLNGLDREYLSSLRYSVNNLVVPSPRTTLLHEIFATL